MNLPTLVLIFKISVGIILALLILKLIGRLLSKLLRGGITLTPLYTISAGAILSGTVGLIILLILSNLMHVGLSTFEFYSELADHWRKIIIYPFCFILSAFLGITLFMA